MLSMLIAEIVVVSTSVDWCSRLVSVESYVTTMSGTVVVLQRPLVLWLLEQMIIIIIIVMMMMTRKHFCVLVFTRKAVC